MHLLLEWRPQSSSVPSNIRMTIYQFYALLKTLKEGAIPDKNVKILIDDAATSKAIRDELSSLASKADANDVVLLYMSGHGLDGAFCFQVTSMGTKIIFRMMISTILNTSAAETQIIYYRYVIQVLCWQQLGHLLLLHI